MPLEKLISNRTMPLIKDGNSPDLITKIKGFIEKKNPVILA